MELQGWQTATKLLTAGKSFFAAQTHWTKWLQTPGGTPFADTGRGGCDTDPITTSYVS
jgi:hypothetical protein